MDRTSVHCTGYACRLSLSLSVCLSLSLSLSLCLCAALRCGAALERRCTRGAMQQRHATQSRNRQRRPRSRYLSRSPPQAPRCSMQPRATLAYIGHERAHTSSSCHQLLRHQRPTLMPARQHFAATYVTARARGWSGQTLRASQPPGERRGARCSQLWLPVTRGRTPQTGAEARGSSFTM